MLNGLLETVLESIKKITDLKWRHFVDDVKVTSPYGYRYLNGKKQFHNGTDYTGINKVAYAPCDCIITEVLHPDKEYPYRFTWDKKKGWIKNETPEGRCWTPKVIMKSTHIDNISFSYLHGKPLVKKGDIVKCGEEVMEVGNYGYSMGSHLHVSMTEDGKYIDPDLFIKLTLDIV